MKEEPAPGGCMPVGVTASGEIVFPFQCKEFIELHRAANRQPAAEENQPTTPDQKPDAAEEKTLAKQSAVTEKPTIAEVKPAAAEEKPVTGEKKPAAAETETTARQEESVAPENSKPVGPVPLPKRVERERVVGPPGCPNFHTYDPASGTYRTFDGQRRQCRAVVGQSFRK